MPYDQNLARRVRDCLAGHKSITEKEMFGGIGFLLRGNMCVGVWKEFLILRLGVEAAEAALEQSFTRPFDITGRAMKGWVMIDREGLQDDGSLREWVNQAVEFVRTLPAK